MCVEGVKGEGVGRGVRDDWGEAWRVPARVLRTRFRGGSAFDHAPLRHSRRLNFSTAAELSCFPTPPSSPPTPTRHPPSQSMLSAGRPSRPAPLSLPTADAGVAPPVAGGSPVDGTPPVTPADEGGGGGSLARLFDALTPHTRKVSRLPLVEVRLGEREKEREVAWACAAGRRRAAEEEKKAHAARARVFFSRSSPTSSFSTPSAPRRPGAGLPPGHPGLLLLARPGRLLRRGLLLARMARARCGGPCACGGTRPTRRPPRPRPSPPWPPRMRPPPPPAAAGPARPGPGVGAGLSPPSTTWTTRQPPLAAGRPPTRPGQRAPPGARLGAGVPAVAAGRCGGRCRPP